MSGWEKVAVMGKWPGEAQQATPLGLSNSAHSPGGGPLRADHEAFEATPTRPLLI